MKKLIIALSLALALPAMAKGPREPVEAPAQPSCWAPAPDNFWFWCESGNTGFVYSRPSRSYFIRTLYEQANEDLEFNGIAYAVDGRYFLKGSNEPIGDANAVTLVMEIDKGFFVVYR